MCCFEGDPHYIGLDLSPTPNAPMCFFFNRKMLVIFVIIFRVESEDDDSETFVNGSGSE